MILVDDFKDDVNIRIGDAILTLHEKYNIAVIHRDVVRDGLGEVCLRALDTYTSFDSMEHWHRSPKKVFHQVAGSLAPDGVFVLGAPNCVNLRKRLTVPLGAGKWSSMNDWYEKEISRGHIREPDVDDLLYIARDVRLSDVRIFGRNWAGYNSPNKLTRAVTRIVDFPLRAVPSFCSDIYLVARRRVS